MPEETAVIVFEDKYPMVSSQNMSVLEASINNLATETLTKRDLFMIIPNPSGGKESWEIETPAGTKTYEKLTGVILHVGSERSYYDVPYDEREDDGPPLCSSDDGIIGKGDPGGRCAECAMAKFGENGEAPECSQKKPLYMLIPKINPIMPMRLNVPSTNFPKLRDHLKKLTQFGINVFDMEVELSLRQSTTKNNRPTSLVQFKNIRNIREQDPEGHAKIVDYKNKLVAAIDPAFAQFVADATNDTAA